MFLTFTYGNYPAALSQFIFVYINNCLRRALKLLKITLSTC